MEFDTALDVLFSAYEVKFSAAEKKGLWEMMDRDGSGSVTCALLHNYFISLHFACGVRES